MEKLSETNRRKNDGSEVEPKRRRSGSETGMHNVRASEPCEACEPCEADTRGMQKMRGTSRGTGNT